MSSYSFTVSPSLLRLHKRPDPPMRPMPSRINRERRAISYLPRPKRNGRPSAIADFPPELLSRVFEFCSRKSLMALCLTSHSFYNPAADALFATPRLPLYADGASFRKTLKAYPGRARRIVSLRIMATTCAVNWLMWLRSVTCRKGFANVKALEFVAPTYGSDEMDVDCSVPFVLAVSVAAGFPALRRLSFNKVTLLPLELDMLALSPITPTLHSLQRLELTQFDWQSSDSAIPFLVKSMPSLETLYIASAGWSSFSHADIQCLSKFQRLRYLRLSGQANTREAIDAVPNLFPRLEGLDCNLVWGRSPMTFSSRFFDAPMWKCRDLRISLGRPEIASQEKMLAHALGSMKYPRLERIHIRVIDGMIPFESILFETLEALGFRELEFSRKCHVWVHQFAW